MKLLFQSDDYGITPAVADGIIYGIENGIIRNTGLFANMPWAEECVEKIRPYLGKIALGIDLNASTGPSLLGYDKVPNLCHEDGTFLTSRENRKADETAPDHDHVSYDQVYAEFKAQIERFIELVGRKPDYVHGHAYGTKTTERARNALAHEYGCITSTSIMKALQQSVTTSWYVIGGPEAQLTEDPIGFITSGKACDLTREYGYIICHAGYADARLFSLSSYNLCRVKDLEAAASKELKQWVEDNHIELISFKDLKKEDWEG